MATILAFKQASAMHRHGPAAQRREPLPTTMSSSAPMTADIVFFTGIRYERWDDTVDSLQSDASGHMTVRRDRLEVGE